MVTLLIIVLWTASRHGLVPTASAVIGRLLRFSAAALALLLAVLALAGAGLSRSR